MPLTVVSYNVLADSYIKPAFYRDSPPSALDRGRRWPRLLAHLQALGADMLCLQEVEPAMFDHLHAGLGPLGYAGTHAVKRGRPDGCATFVGPRLQVLGDTVLHYNDAPAGDTAARASGHLALLTRLSSPDGPMLVANTHLKWHEAGLSPAAQWGWRQARELLEHLGAQADCGPQLACGDFNVNADSDVVRLFEGAGWVDVYGDRPRAHTCAPNHRAKRIDFIFHTGMLRAEPWGELRMLDDDSALPSDDEPSDHLAIGALLHAIA